MDYPETLECQDCGKVLMELTNAQAQEVANKPYNFVVYCFECKKERS